MEGVGSRLGRTSSRYGPVSSAPVFSGPVRKWKRQWVISRPNNNTTTNNGRGSNNHHGGPTAAPLLLFRWTPLPSSDESPKVAKRKFRYTPVVALEEKKKEGFKKADVQEKASKMNQSIGSETPSSDDVFEKMNLDDDIMKEIQSSE